MQPIIYGAAIDRGGRLLVEADRIDLAHEADFRLARLAVSPPRRLLLREDGQQEVVEHRVMQVLIALAKAKGAIVTRDELIQRCWDGRVVGDDAINRVISRLRKASSRMGDGSFVIETITKVGYRLTYEGMSPVSSASVARRHADPDLAAVPIGHSIGRRSVLAGGAAIIAGFGGGALLFRRLANPTVSPEVQALMTQGWQSWAQATSEGPAQAIGFYRRATELAPDYADAWGLLGCTYADAAHRGVKAEAANLRDHARAAARQAFDLDPQNAYAHVATAFARPMMGSWLLVEREFRRAHDDQPDRQLVIHGLGSALLRVGRFAEAAAELRNLLIKPDAPITYYLRVLAEWGAGRIEQADRLMAEGLALYPMHATLWYESVELAMFGGNPGKAIAQIRDEQNRPSGMDQVMVSRLIALGEAIASQDPRQVANVAGIGREWAHRSRYDAENAILAMAALGRIDDAFTLLDAYYFSRGFVVPDSPPKFGKANEARLDERSTVFLFLPVMRQVHADPRFDRLTATLGLKRYWRDIGVQPDFRHA